MQERGSVTRTQPPQVQGPSYSFVFQSSQLLTEKYNNRPEANSQALGPEQLMNIKRLQGLAQALFSSDSFPPMPSSTHRRQHWANLKNNTARLFQSPADCLSEKEAGRMSGSRPVGSPSFSKHAQAQKTGQALCWVQGDGTPRTQPL